MRRLLLAPAIIAGLLLAVIIRERTISAADSESITWGASDPTWSPDGKRLAFSLFGSIWQVDAAGGEASQITASPGYHAYPAWSPKGDAIAFVNGVPPAGQLPRISGRLLVVNPATGAEREITTSNPVSGTVAWTPGGGSLICGLAVPNAGAILHEIQVADGSATALQQRPQRGPAAPWTSVSVAKSSGEIFFTGNKTQIHGITSGPQIWSMPGGRPPIVVQLPLTGYRREDIAQVTQASAIPDGSGVIYSAAIVNGKGDHELYRVPRGGGKPVAITNTERDEFAPAVSPDGREVAHVSNHMGNIDLFVMPVKGGDKRHVKITGLKFRSASGRMRVKTMDETGQPSPVRLFVRASDTKAYAPAGSQIFYYPLEPGPDREGFFIARGTEEFPVPAGRVRLTALKGVEYRIAERNVDVAAGETAEVTIQMERWTNWSQRGWHTGENHFHANYNGSYYQRPKQSLEWLEAEDLNSANMIVANSEGAFIHDKEFFKGAVDPISKPRYVLYWGQEYRNSDPLGHMGFWNIKKQVPPSFTSVIGSNAPYDFPLNTMAALEAKKQGGRVTYMHPISGATNDVFDTSLGAKEAPITAALGALDAIDVLPYGDPAYHLWYRLLNSGFRISPGAGTDVFTNWRGINNIPGGSRNYVDVGSEMNWDRWVARYAEGRTFVTNAPLVDFHVNGQGPGAEIKFAEGGSMDVDLRAEITAKVSLARAEFIENGRVISTQELNGAESGRMEYKARATGSAWYAVRVIGRPSRGVTQAIPRAHSGAVWVLVGAKPVLVRDDLELMVRWIERLWLYLEERNNFGPGDNRTRARKMFDDALAHYRAKLAKAGA